MAWTKAKGKADRRRAKMPATVGLYEELAHLQYGLGKVASSPYWDLAFCLVKEPGIFRDSIPPSIFAGFGTTLKEMTEDAISLRTSLEKGLEGYEIESLEPRRALDIAEVLVQELSSLELLLKQFEEMMKPSLDNIFVVRFHAELQRAYEAYYALYQGTVDFTEELTLVPELHRRISKLDEEKKRARSCKVVLAK